MITITFNDHGIQARLEKFGPALQTRLVRVITAAVIDLQRHVVVDKLQGQVLQHRSGNLQRAIQALPTLVTGTTVRGQLTVDRTAPYGVFHEFGVAHSWVIRPRRPGGVLAFSAGGQMVFAREVTHPGLKERSFMRSALADRRADIVARISAAVGDTVRGNA